MRKPANSGKQLRVQRSGCVAVLALLCAGYTGMALAQSNATRAAQAYPTKPIRFIVGFGAGGGNDMIARTLSQKLSDNMGQPVIVDNRAGSAGIVAAVIAAKALQDGYTLFGGSISTLATNVSMRSKLPYDPLRDFEPVTTTTLSPYLCAVNPAVRATTLKEFIALAKSAQGKLNYASAGSGSGNHLSHELFKFMAGIDLVHIPYKGAAGQVTALLGGEVQLSCIQVQVALPLVRSGRLRALAITSAQRLVVVSDVPTIAEAGVPGYEATSWQGVVVPTGTPRAIIERLYREIVKVLQTPEVRDRLATQGTMPGGITPREFAVHIRREIAKWAKIVKVSGAKAD